MLQGSEELIVRLPERVFGNLRNHFAEALLIAPAVRSPEEDDRFRMGIDLAKGRVAAVALICCRLDQSLFDQPAETVSQELFRVSITCMSSSSASFHRP